MDENVVFCNTDSASSAKLIASALVESKLAACVSIFPNIISVYEWEGKIENREEFTLMIKSKETFFEELKEKILQLHPDTVPEIISLDIKNGLSSYLNWMDEVLK